MSEDKLFQKKDINLNFIKENFLKMPTQKIAEHLGVTRGTINRRAKELGLRKSKFPFKRLKGEKVVNLTGELKRYGVTNLGRVINLEEKTLLMPKSNHNGYLLVTFQVDYKRIEKLVHILVANAFIPNPENKPYVNHIDGIKTNANASNLEWVTPKENAEHASKMGLLPVGEKHNNSEVSKKQATEIINSYIQGLGISEIVRKYDFATKSIVEKIIYRQNWVHLWEELENNNSIPKVTYRGKKPARGEQNGSAKLTEKQAKEIILHINDKKKIFEILKLCPFATRQQISYIKSKKTWKYLWDNLERATTIKTASDDVRE